MIFYDFEELILKNIIFIIFLYIIFSMYYIFHTFKMILIKQYEIFKFLKNNDLSLKEL